LRCEKGRRKEKKRKKTTIRNKFKNMHVSKSDRLSPPLRHSRNMHSRSYQVPLCRTQQRKAIFKIFGSKKIEGPK
jgi:hypothetical protein